MRFILYGGGAFPGQSAVITSYGPVLERQFDKYSIGRPNELEAFRRTGTLLLYLAGGVLGDVGVNAAGTNENESLNFIGSEAWRSRVRRVRSSIAYYAPDLTAVVPFFTPYYNQLRQGYAQLLEERGENEFVRLSANSVFRQSLFDLVVERMAP